MLTHKYIHNEDNVTEHGSTTVTTSRNQYGLTNVAVATSVDPFNLSSSDSAKTRSDDDDEQKATRNEASRRHKEEVILVLEASNNGVLR